MSDTSDFETDTLPRAHGNQALVEALFVGAIDSRRAPIDAEPIYVQLDLGDAGMRYVEFSQGAVEVLTVVQNITDNGDSAALRGLRHWWIIGSVDDEVIVRDDGNGGCITRHSSQVFREDMNFQPSRTSPGTFRLRRYRDNFGRGRMRRQREEEARRQRMRRQLHYMDRRQLVDQPEEQRAEDGPAIISDDEAAA